MPAVMNRPASSVVWCSAGNSVVRSKPSRSTTSCAGAVLTICGGSGCAQRASDERADAAEIDAERGLAVGLADRKLPSTGIVVARWAR